MVDGAVVYSVCQGSQWLSLNVFASELHGASTALEEGFVLKLANLNFLGAIRKIQTAKSIQME